ncbi:MAG: ABC transporter permease subunit [Clostridia bacterium]|nr:ABC transporter permease subunit [Clostridia bacterium]
MSKLIALYKNEMKRVFGRPAIWIGLGLAFALTLAFSFVARENIIGRRSSTPVGDQAVRELEEWIAGTRDQIERNKVILDQAKQNLQNYRAEYEAAALVYDTDRTEENKKALQEAESHYAGSLNANSSWLSKILYCKINLKVFELRLEYQILREDYRVLPLQAVQEELQQKYPDYITDVSLDASLEKYETLTADFDSIVQEYCDKIDNYRSAIENADFDFFIKELKKLAEQEEDSFKRTAEIEAYEFILSGGTGNVGLESGREAVRMAGDYVSARSDQLERLEDDRTMSYPSTNELAMQVRMLKTDLRNRISIDRAERTKKLDERLLPYIDGSDPNVVINQSLAFGGMIAVLLTVIIIAAGSIAGPIKDGSIKSIIIAPVRRSKIFWSKVLMLLTVTLLLSVATAIFALIAGSAVTGVWDHGRVLYNSGNSPRILPYWLATLLSVLIDAVGIFFFAVLALLLSSLTRNALISAILPTGYFIVNLVMGLAAADTFGRLTRAVLPMQNLSNLWFCREVPSMLNVNAMFEESGWYTIKYILHPFGCLYSAIYVIVLLGVLLWAARDSFCRRDLT